MEIGGSSSAKRLPTTPLSDYMEQRINTCLPVGTKEVIVRVVSSYHREFIPKDKLKSLLQMLSLPDKFPYSSKVILCFQATEEREYVLFLGIYVQEYDSACPMPNQNSIYLAMLDSVKLFEPLLFRRDAYYLFLISYLEYKRLQGFKRMFWWSCPPKSNDEYLFYHRPKSMTRTAKMRTQCLSEFYTEFIDFSKSMNIMEKCENLHDWCKSYTALFFDNFPYFDEDHWPEELQRIIDSVYPGTTLLELKKEKERGNSWELVFAAATIRMKVMEELLKLKDSFYCMTLSNADAGLRKLFEQVKDDDDFVLPLNITATRDALITFFKGDNLEFKDKPHAMIATTALVNKISGCNAVQCAKCAISIIDTTTTGYFCKTCMKYFCKKCVKNFGYYCSCCECPLMEILNILPINNK